jgi:hypothetical protein
MGGYLIVIVVLTWPVPKIEVYSKSIGMFILRMEEQC